MSKPIFIGILALILASLTFIGLLHVINQPVEMKQEKEPEPQIEFVDITFDQTECHAVTDEIRSLLDAPQTCETAGDCTFAYFGCPFGCQSVVNVSNEQAINNFVTNRNQICQVQCNYRCKKVEKEKVPACIDNLCKAIETIDTDKTIDQFLEENHPLKQ